MIAPAANTWPCRIVAERDSDRGPTLVAVAHAIASQLSVVLGSDPFTWDIESEPPRPITLDDTTLASLLARLRRGRPFLLADRPTAWTALFTIAVAEHLGRDQVSLSLPSSDQPPLVELDRMIALVELLRAGLGAPVAYVDDAALGHTYAGRRAHARSLANIPAEIRGLINKAPFEDVPDLAGPLPQLRVASELPIEIPPGVYWINAWSARSIDALGRARVFAAPWARVVEGPEGAATFVATIGAPDLTRREDVAALAALVTALDLETVHHAAVP